MDKKQTKEYIDRIFQLFWKEGVHDAFFILNLVICYLYLKRLDEKGVFEASGKVSPFADESVGKCKWGFLKKLDEREFGKNYMNVVIPFLTQQVIGSYPIFYFLNNHRQIIKENSLANYELFCLIDELLDKSKKSSENVVAISSYGYIYKELLNQYHNVKEKKQVFVPRHIARLMCELAELKVEDSIYTPNLETGDLLVTAYRTIVSDNLLKENKNKDEDGFAVGDVSDSTFSKKQLDNLVLDGNQTSYEDMFLTTMNFYFHDMSLVHDFTIQNLLSSDFKPATRKYSKIIAAPLLGSLVKGQNVDEKLKERVGNNSSAMYIERCLEQLDEGGRLVILIPEGFLFAHNSKTSKYREHILESCTLEALISLPIGVLPNTSVKTSILVISKKMSSIEGKVWLCELKNDGYSLNSKRLRNSETPLPQLVEMFKGREEGANSLMDCFKVSQLEMKMHQAAWGVNFYNEYNKPEFEHENPQNIISDLKDLEQDIMLELVKLSNLLDL